MDFKAATTAKVNEIKGMGIDKVSCLDNQLDVPVANFFQALDKVNHVSIKPCQYIPNRYFVKTEKYEYSVYAY